MWNTKYLWLTHFEPLFELEFTGLAVSHNHNNIRLTLCRTSFQNFFVLTVNMEVWNLSGNIGSIMVNTIVLVHKAYFQSYNHNGNTK